MRERLTIYCCPYFDCPAFSYDEGECSVHALPFVRMNYKREKSADEKTADAFDSLKALASALNRAAGK